MGGILQQNSDLERLLAKHKGKMKNSLTLTVPLKSKLPVASRFRRDANRVARESSKRKMSGIN